MNTRATNLTFLLVEDDIDLAIAVVEYLSLEDIQCDHVANGLSALTLVENNRYDVVILDLNLPKMNGLDVCEKLRHQGIDVPILMLTARDTLDDKLIGFSKGADDYLVKPFAMEELIVRAQVLSRRRSGEISRFTVADLVLDIQEKSVKRGNKILKLSPTAFKLLELLMRVSPSPISREDLMQGVWGDAQPDSNSLKVHMYHLRKQVDGNNEHKLVHTIPNQGFAVRLEERE